MSENPTNIIKEIKDAYERFNTLNLEQVGMSPIHKDIPYNEKLNDWSIDKRLIYRWYENGDEEFRIGHLLINKEGEEGYMEGSIVEIFRRTKRNYEFDYFVRPFLASNCEITIQDLPKLKEVYFWPIENERIGEKAKIRVIESKKKLSYSPSPS